MKKRSVRTISLSLFAVLCGTTPSRAQNKTADHLAAAKAAARQEFTALYSALCVDAKAPAPPPATPGKIPPPPPASEWHADPAKVYDNLYFVGSKPVSAWAVNTSDGVILIDALFEYSVEDEIVNGLKKSGLDPAKIKYLIVTHGHTDHYLGARYLQDKFGVRVIMSAQDWDYMQRDKDRVKPRKDMVATDGQKLTLGDTTLTMYITPGHTPGTISLLIPVKEGGQTHLAAMYGGTAYNFQWSPEAFQIYAKSTERFRDIVDKSPVDILLTNHPQYSSTFEKIDALKSRKPGSANPFTVGNDATKRYISVLNECAQYQLARLPGSPKN